MNRKNRAGRAGDEAGDENRAKPARKEKDLYGRGKPEQHKRHGG